METSIFKKTEQTHEEEEPPLSFLHTFYPKATINDWNDWRWQLKNSITTLQQLQKIIDLEEYELEAISKESLPMRITPYYASLLWKKDSSYCIRRAVIPTIYEFKHSKYESIDPLGEEHDSPVKCIVHRYPDRVLFLATTFCGSNCRYSLAKGTKILMSDFSEKNIEDIKIDDLIITHSGRIKKVYETFNRLYNKNLIKIKTSRNLSITTTEEHPFLILKRKDIRCNQGLWPICKPNSRLCTKRHPNKVTDFTPKFMDAKYIEVGDFIATPRYKNDSTLYNNIHEAYIMGLYIADGDLPVSDKGVPKGIRYSLGLHSKKDVAKKLEYHAREIGITKIFHSKNASVNIHFIWLKLDELFYKIKENCGMYSEKKKLSEDILFNSSDEYKVYLLRGMLDGDGWYGTHTSQRGKYCSIEWNTVSKTLANQIFMMLIQLGFNPSIYISDEIGKEKKSNKVKNIVIAKHLMYSIRLMRNGDWNNFFNFGSIKEKSKGKSFITEDYLFSEVKSIGNIENKDLVYDLSVEEDESFVANFFSVHNCTRSRIVGHAESEPSTDMWEEGLQYIKEHIEVRDVLISGGDPLTMDTTRLEYLLYKLRRIPHVEIVRIGTKVPVVLPQRIDTTLIDMLKQYHPLYMNIHFTHPDEITDEVKAACVKLADNGVVLGSQTVLLCNINDQPETIKKLYHELLKIRVKPYILYMCDPILGSSHFRTSVEKGLEIIHALRGFTSGLAVPQLIIDAPGGGGKIPLLPDYYVGKKGDVVQLQNYEGKYFEYPA